MKIDPVKSLMEIYAIRELELYKKFGEESESNFYDITLMSPYVKFSDFTASITRIDDKNDPYKLKPTRVISLLNDDAKLTFEYNHKCLAQLEAIKDSLIHLAEELAEQMSRITSNSALLISSPEYALHGSEIRDAGIELNEDLRITAREHIPVITTMDHAVEVYDWICDGVRVYADKTKAIIPDDDEFIKPLIERLLKILSREA